MDAGSTPEWVGEAHLPDQPPNLWRYTRPAGTPTRFPAPEGAKTCPRSADDGFGLYEREGVQNTRRDPIQADKDHTIEVSEERAATVTLDAAHSADGAERVSLPQARSST